MCDPDLVGVTLSISMAGYVLGGSSYFMALLAGGAWAGLVYYCCHELYDSYIRERLNTDMSDIQAHFLDNPDNGFWVAEAQVNGRSEVAGMVAVVGRRGARDGKANGGASGGRHVSKDGPEGGYGEIFRTIVSFPYRRTGLGTRLTETAMDFCKERGFTRVVLEVSSAQTAAIALYGKLGFKHILTHTNTHAHRWVTRLARISIQQMEKLC